MRLEQNYRSSGTILAAANQVIRHNTRRKAKTLRTTRPAGAPLEWLLGEDEREELERVVTHLKLARLREGLTWADFAILYRSNHQSRAVEELLREEGIPYQLVGGTRFYERREVKDALAYLRLVHEPLDEVSLNRVLNFPRRGIGRTSQARLLDYAAHQGRPPFAVLREASQFAEFTGAAGTAMQRFAELIDRYRTRFAAEPLGATFRELLAEVGFHRAVEKERTDPKAADRATGLIHELEFAVDQFCARRERPTLKDYLEHVALLTLPEENERGARTPMVSLMTVHAAKGLEFPHVYLVGVEEEMLPHRASLAEDRLEEERRLAYVGITRAQRSLALTLAEKRRRWGEDIDCEPSRFLDELPAEDVVWEGTRAPTDEDTRRATGREQMANLRELLGL